MANKTYNDHPTDNTPAADDLIPYWDVAAGAAKKAVRSAVIGATITGAGTIATGGNTLTVPASGTAALREAANTFTADQSISGNLGIGTTTPQATLDVRGRMYSTGALGWQYVKSGVPHGMEIGVCSYTVSALTCSSVLVSVSLSGTGRLGSQIWAVSTAWGAKDVQRLSSALFGYTGCTLTARMNTSTRECTLFVNQTNADSEAVQVSITIQPIGHPGSGINFSFTGY